MVAVAGAVLVWVFSNVRLVADGSALARVELQPFAGSLVSVRRGGLTDAPSRSSSRTVG